MRRRNITIRGDKGSRSAQRFNEIKSMLRERFRQDENALDDMIRHVLETGWNGDDIRSYNTQYENKHRPPVDAFLFNSEHVLDQLFLTQGMYTGMADTASDPNYAMRHKGQTELIFRRLTPGDLLLMQAAQNNASRDCGRVPAPEQHDYWRSVLYEILFTVVPLRDRGKLAHLFEDPYACAARAVQFLENSAKHGGEYPCYTLDTFMDRDSPYYVGIRTSYETRRNGDGFDRGWYFTEVNHPSSETLSMASAVMFCYGIDNYARQVMEGYRTLPLGDSYHSILTSYLTSFNTPPVYFKEPASNGDKEANERAEERDGFLGLGPRFR